VITVDLDRLGDRHPVFSPEIAAGFALRAAHALQRRHEPGVRLDVRSHLGHHEAQLRWALRADRDLQQLDRERVTEEGAEAIALSLVHALWGWQVRRRLQRAEYGDWLLRQTHRCNLVLEVSGTDHTDAESRLRAKVEQVQKSAAANSRVACVVSFQEPLALLQSAPRPER
jgi:hypothetical protein